MKINVVVFLTEGKKEVMREACYDIFEHSLSEIGPTEKRTNEELCQAVKNRIMHHLSLEPEEIRENIKHVVVISGLDIGNPEKFEEMIKMIPPVKGWTGYVFAFWFPYVNTVYDPEVPITMMLPVPPWFGGKKDWARFIFLLLFLYPLYKIFIKRE